MVAANFHDSGFAVYTKDMMVRPEGSEMSGIRPRIPYTYDDYRTLPESMDRRYELLQGELYMVPAPNTAHQIISADLQYLLTQHTRATRSGRVLASPVDVVFGEGRAREVAQPDLVFISTARLHIVKQPAIEGAPDLVVEILSGGTQERDRGYKFTLYARYGVPEYWMIDPIQKLVEVCVLGANGYGAPRRHGIGATLESVLLPGLHLSVADIFAGLVDISM